MPKVVGLRFSFTAVLIGVSGAYAGQPPNPDLEHSLDAIFQKWNKPDVPGWRFWGSSTPAPRR